MENEKINNIRHSLSHLLAAAVLKKYPGTKLGIGPVIENGFYYDFLFEKPMSDSDLKELQSLMKKMIGQALPFEGKEVSAKEAKKLFEEEPFKLELIDELSKDGSKISIYSTGEIFKDLCRGGHVKNTKEIDPDSFKLDKVAGAYWKGSEKNAQLTRIYGLAFENKVELDKYEAMRAEAEKRDHKVLGPKLDLFVFSELVGGGLPLWTPKGTLVRNLLDDFVWSLRREKGYERVEIPHITKKELYETSGHWEKFKDDLFKIKTREDHLFAMKPMNCPHHTQIYARKKWSYRELPQRYANTTMVYRDEQSGELSGLSRVRSITQDDAHVFCRMSQAKNELLAIWDIVEKFYGAFGLKLRLRLSLHDPEHPEKYLGDKKKWDEAEDILREIAKSKKLEYFEAPGEAAFYGPKLDFMAADSLGREWQVATIQLDLNMPERFDLSCVNEEGKNERIVMVHAAIMGAIERFLSIIIEHFAGELPLWLSPVQVAVLPVGEKFFKYGEKIKDLLDKENIRVELGDVNETLGKRIREAEMQKIPYVLVVGEKEETNGTVNVRHYRRGQEGELKSEELIEKIRKEITDKII